MRSVAKRRSDGLSRCQLFVYLSSPGLVSLAIPLAHSSLRPCTRRPPEVRGKGHHLPTWKHLF